MTNRTIGDVDYRPLWGESMTRHSVSALLDDCRKAISQGRRYDGVRGGNFIGRNDIENIEDAMANSYKALDNDVAKVTQWRRELQGVLSGLIPDMRQKMVYSENRGREISVRRLLDGDSRFRRGRRRVPVDNRCVSLVVDVGMLGGYSTEAGFMRTAAAIAIADLLEQQDIRVEIWGHSSASGSYRSGGATGYEAVWKVKAAEAPLNLTTVVAGTSAWFFRTVIFQHRHTYRQPSSGMGSTRQGTDEIARRMTDNNQAVMFAVQMDNNLDRMKENCKAETTRIVEMLLRGGDE